MRLSAFALATTRETPANAEIVSHQLMLRAGMIRRLGAGLYTWTPLGLRVLRKVENIVREEMTAAGALEVLMPAIQPAELWQQTGRWDKMGDLMLRLKDRSERDYCFGPTHEEVVTDFVKRDISSYKQLPVNFFQIQTKFRDEIRPRFGLMRAREFIMKDGYSFHVDAQGLDAEYQNMRAAYIRILDRLGVKYSIVNADSGDIGGAKSEEFHVLAQSGEDELAVAVDGSYAANIEAAATIESQAQPAAATQPLTAVATPNVDTIEQVCEFFNVDAKQTAKTIVVRGTQDQPVILVVRGDHELNEIKAQELDDVASPLEFADEDTLLKYFNTRAGSLGPVGDHGLKVYADYAVNNAADLIVGANKDGYHYTGFNWERDAQQPRFVDLRNVSAGDTTPNGKSTFEIVRGIEVGHIFQLGDKYSKALELSVLDQSGRSVTPQMGCYGFGVSRMVAAAIEQCFDDKGIIWPKALAPFELVILPIKAKKSAAVREAAEALYRQCQQAGIEVAYDDRGLRPGPMFADAELIGIPYRVVVSERGLDQGVLEFKGRSDAASYNIEHSFSALQKALAQ